MKNRFFALSFLALLIGSTAQADLTSGRFNLPAPVMKPMKDYLLQNCPKMFTRESMEVTDVRYRELDAQEGVYSVEIIGRGYIVSDPFWELRFEIGYTQGSLAAQMWSIENTGDCR